IGDVEGGKGTELVDRSLFALQGAIEVAEQFVDVIAYQLEQQFLLGRDVVVERARLNPDFGGELAQAHGREPVLEDQAQPRLADRLHRLRAVRTDRPCHGASGYSPPWKRAVDRIILSRNDSSFNRL